MNLEEPDHTLPSQWLILIALSQGLALLLLHEAIHFEIWPHNQPQWLFSFYSMAVAAPLMLLLSLERGNVVRLLAWTLPFTLLAGVLGYYVGWQASPWEYLNPFSLLFYYVVTLALLTFKVLLYTQVNTAKTALNYNVLFQFSWRNFFTLSLSLLFMGLVWGALMLWAALFKTVDIDFFYDLFTETWFYYPALALTHGFGVLIFRRQVNVIDTITALLQALMKFVLVLLVLVGLLFLATLLFTGLAPLWETGRGSTLILWLQALTLFTLNGVYQDKTHTWPYPLWLHRLVYTGIAVLPVYSAISFYGLSLRVDQYGWTVARLLGYFIWAFLAAYSLGYLASIIRLRDRWLTYLSRVNIGMGLVLIAGLILINTPLLDFRKIATQSQLARFRAGDLELDAQELRHFHQHLGRPGYLALQQLKAEFESERPDLALRIDNAYTHRSQRASPDELDAEAVRRLLAQHHHGEIPEAVLDAILNWVQDTPYALQDVQSTHLISVDLNKNGQNDYVLIVARSHWHTAWLFHATEHDWETVSLRLVNAGSDEVYDALMQGLAQGEIATRPRSWQDLRIGDAILRVDSD